MDRSRHSQAVHLAAALPAESATQQPSPQPVDVDDHVLLGLLHSRHGVRLQPSCFLINVSTSTSILFLSMAVNNSPQRIRCIEVSSPGQPAVKLLKPNHFSSNYTFGTGTLLLRMPCSVKRACGLDNSAARRRRFWVTLVSVAERLCSCSLAKQAEYPSTHKYSFPCTSIFSAAARTPGWASLQAGSCSTLLSRNSTGAWFHGRAEIHPTPAFSSSNVLANAAEPLSSTSVTVSRAI